MVWGIIAGAGLALNMGIGMSERSNQRKVAKAEYKLNKQRAQDAEMLNAYNNAKAMAEAELNTFMQRRQNNKVLEASGEALSQSRRNTGKQIDQLNSDKMNARMESASQLGSLAAEAAFAGVGGGSVDMVAETERFRAERINQAISDQIKEAEYVQALNEVAIADNAYASMDFGYQFANLNYKARDMVTDQSWQYKNNLVNMARDGIAGFTGNLSTIGLDLSGFMGKDTAKDNNGLGGSKEGSTPSASYNRYAGATRL